MAKPLSASLHGMAKRGNAGIGTVSTEEQWKNCISKPGLSLFDIYSECWGPCLAIQPTFRQLQMEFGDGLSIMLAETDNIEELNKFRGTSQPLFLLYCKGVPIAYMKGANQPKLLDLVRRCSKDQKENKKIVNIFEDPTPEEEALARSMSLASNSQKSATELSDFTLALIKPDAVRAGFVEDIINELNENGLIVISQQEHTMTAEEVHKFYSHISTEPYFLNLVDYMTSGPTVALVLAKVNPSERPVCEILKELRGPKDLACAKQEKPASLRAKFGVQSESGVENAFHSSDTSDTAVNELAFFFPNFKNETAGLERTLCIIRPDTNKQYKETILSRLTELGFSIALQREFVMTRTMAETFYRKHREEPFFEVLVSQMISGPSLVLALCSRDAVRQWRSVLGPTLVPEAKETAPESMRATFTTDDIINGLHGSSTAEEAVDELNFFFPAEQTVACIKPEMMEKKEEIMKRIEEAGIVIQAQKTVTLSQDEAGSFYDEHKNKEFYGDLCSYMASGESTFLVLSANNAVEKWREIIGPADPSEAKATKPQSLRSKLGKDILKNGLHGSSSAEHALKSIEQIFGASMTIRSSKSKSFTSQGLDTSEGIAEIGSVQGATDKTENDVCSDLPTDSPKDNNKSSSQRTLEDAEKSDSNDNEAKGETEQKEVDSPEKQAEPSSGEQAGEEEKQEEETAVKEEQGEEVKPPAVESEQVHNADGEVETVDALQPSMTNMSEGLSPISEGQEDYFQDSFNSDSSVLREARETLENEVTMTNTPDHTGDELEELPADSDKEGTTPVPEKKED
ncbi:thioredoxin domain-containing protein 6-like isoform X3 [Bolinopsis microptera]|uniref:thioredoxin domain-containing protein 6-like isoform X3 n=1 Tax=Bolinopsis microptera TaxID=2820187 RepID=UPI00307AE9AC